MRVKATFREYENGGTKGFVDFAVNGAIGIKGATLVDGEYGMFVNLPTVRVKDEYRDIVTGVSNDFKNLLVEAAIAARDSENHVASIGEFSDIYYEPHVTALGAPNKKTKALASLTVRDHEGAEKSAFTISHIRIMQGNQDRLFVAMPSVKTDHPDYPYNELCYLTNNSRKFVQRLMLHEANKALGIEKKPSLDKTIAAAANEKNDVAQKNPGMKDRAMEKVGAER